MTTSKLIDNNRRTHAAKVLAEASKKNQEHADHTAHNTEASTETIEVKDEGFGTLNEQYNVIREDILKLREDLAQGYDLLKDFIASKANVRSITNLISSK